MGKRSAAKQTIAFAIWTCPPERPSRERTEPRASETPIAAKNGGRRRGPARSAAKTRRPGSVVRATSQPAGSPSRSARIPAPAARRAEFESSQSVRGERNTAA